MLSKTEQESLGQYKLEIGSGASNSMRVFSVGSLPAILGSVRTLFRFVPSAGGTLLFKLN